MGFQTRQRGFGNPKLKVAGYTTQKITGGFVYCCKKSAKTRQKKIRQQNFHQEIFTPIFLAKIFTAHKRLI